MPSLIINKLKSGPKVGQLKVNDPNVSYVLREEIIEKYGETFIKNIPKIQAVVAQYVNKYSSLYGTRAPSVRIPFTDYDKSNLFKAAGISSDKVKSALYKITSNDIDLRNRVLNDPFNELCAMLTGWFYQNKNRLKKPQNEFAYPYHFTSLYLTMRFYCSIYYRTFRYGDPSPDVMDYTIENLSNKFLLKSVNNIMDIIKYHSETNIENMEERILRGSDVDYVYYCTNLDSRVSNFMKSLARQYYKNYEDKKKIQTESASRKDDEGDFFIGNTSNISSVLESTVRKIIIKFIGDKTIDELILDAASKKTKFSKSKLVVMINRIRENTDDKLKMVLTNIIMYYLVSTGKEVSSMRSSDFVNTMVNLYSISNTKNEIILKIKSLLEDVIKSNSDSILKEGNKNMLDRVKNSVYVYLVLFIAKNVE
jgi:hypothetical protein